MRKFFLENKILILFFSLAFLATVNYASALTLTPIRLEVKGDPGQMLSLQMTLVNEHATPETFYSSFANFEAQGETGSPSFVTPKDGLGTWMSAPSTISLNGGESKIVSFKVAIPKDAEPGGYFAVLFWGTKPAVSSGTSVAIGAKTGILVLLSVNGAVKQGGGILNYDTKDGIHYYESLPILFSYRFKNDGGDRIKPDGDIVIRNILGLKSKLVPANPIEGNILPTQIRYFETTWTGGGEDAAIEAQSVSGFFNKVFYEWRNFAFGRYTAALDLTYGVNGQKAVAQIVIWVFPWHLTLFLIILLLLIFLIGRAGIRHWDHWVIVQAEEMLEYKLEEKEEQEHKNHAGPHSHKKMRD